MKQRSHLTIPTQRRILGVFAHPDDETSGAAGTFAHYTRQGIEVQVVTATRGAALGTGCLSALATWLVTSPASFRLS